MVRKYIRTKPVNNWTPERIEAASALYREGMQAYKVAAAVGKVSTSQVQRMMRKIGVVQGKRPSKRPPKPKQPPKLTLIKNTEPLAIGPLNDFSEPGTCKWIHGDPGRGEWQCCGNATTDGKVYCDHHHARAITKQSEKTGKEFKFQNWGLHKTRRVA